MSMRELWSKVIIYLKDKHNLRKVVIASAAVFLLLGVVLFSSSIQNLLSRPWGSRADDGSDLDWTTDTASLSTSRSNAKIIDVVDSSGTRWLYAIGGVNKVVDDLERDPGLPSPLDGYRINLMKSVERIQLKDDGSINLDLPVSELGWHTVASMNFGHAEFGLIEQDGYIYVIAGDIHLTKTNFDPEGYNPDTPEAYYSPLLYSTIEKLDINDAEENGGDILAFADGGDDLVTVISTNHGLSSEGGDIVTITGTVDYNGSHAISNVTADTFDITAVWVEDTTGWWSENKWEIPALLSGVNFYPEVTEYRGKIHIVGGVFGNPFNSGVYNMWGGYSGQDPLVVKDDLSDWDTFDFGNKPVIGDTPISIPGGGGDDPGGIIMGSLNDPSHFACNDNPLDSGVFIQGVGDLPNQWPWEWPWYNPWIDDNPWFNLSHLWSQMLLNGEFYTTVSEHYILDLSDGELDENDYWAGELGVDYSSINELWEQDANSPWVYSDLKLVHQRVFKFGHLRLYLTSSGYCNNDMQWVSFPIIISPPQGRYGHKLIAHNYDDDLSKDDDLLVVGGTSWSNPIASIYCWLSGYNCYGGVSCLINLQYTFWVNDDLQNPFNLPVNSGYPAEAYKYIGNIAYKWRLNTLGGILEWDGTNANNASFTNTGQLIDGSSTRKLGDQYAFALSGSGEHKGRAFFGMAQLDFSGGDNIFDKNAFVATGGLQNNGGIEGIGIPPSTRTYQPISITNRVERLEEPYAGWESDLLPWVEEDNLSTYNLSSIGIDNYRSISFDGQIEFQDAEPTFNSPLNIHVPDYTKSASKLTQMFNNIRWLSMPDPDDLEGSKLLKRSHSAVKSVRTVEDGIVTVYIYKVGGASGASPGWLPEVDNSVQVLGPFTYGEPGKPNIGTSVFTVDPSIVKADGVSYATATLTLRDYYETPIANVAAIVATENNSSWPPNGTDNILIRPLNDTQIGPPGWPSPWLLTDANGQVKFRLTSTEEILLDQVCVYISTSDTPPATKADCDQFVMPCLPITFTLDGAVSYLNSTIDADPYKVAADGIEYSTVTVTLLDHQDPPQPITTEDYFVKILPDKNWVSVQNMNQKINSNGQAVFRVRSSIRGKTNIFARYSLSSAGLEDPNEYMMLVDTATVEFGAMIESLVPDYGYQGDNLPDVTATGKATHWSDDTEVEFIPPSKFSFHWISLSGERDIEDLSLMANGQVTSKIGIWAPSFPSTNVTFDILDRSDSTDPGNFWPDNDSNPSTPYTTYSTNTDSNGKAYFRLRTSRDPGFTKIHTTIGGSSSDLWLIIQDPDAFQYELEMLASPVNLATGGEAEVRAGVYKTDGTGRHLVSDVLNFNFLADAINSTLNPENTSSTDGIALTQYTRSSENGRFHVFAWTKVAYGIEELFIASKTIVNHKPPLPNSGQITIGSITVNSPTKLIANLVSIGQTADLGFWTFRTSTPFSGVPSESIFDEEVAEYPFQVLPVGWQTEASIDISPRSGLRGMQNYRINITGFDTHFDSTSVVAFSPPTGGSSIGIKIVDGSLDVDNELALNLRINIEHDATVGYWNVSVTTGNEVAIMPGDYDFLVHDSSNYAIDLKAVPDEIVRDGSKSKITATVIYIDPLTGQRSLVKDVTVYFTIVNNIGSLSANSATTNQDGQAFVEYTSDAGIENVIAVINATASPESGVLIGNWVDISLIVNPYNYKLTANPTEIPLYGGTGISNLSISGLPTGQRIPITLHFDNNPKGHIQPTATTSDTQGTAGSTYVAAPEGQRVVEIVRVYALATVPGYGQVRSNIAEIQIGRDASKYKIELTAVPNSVIAGGAQRSTVTAVLYFQSQVVAKWPIDFALLESAPGDYLTILSGTTGALGTLITYFVPGNTEGAVIVKAYPTGLGIFGEDIIAKTADKFPDICLSNISAVSHYVPADGTSYSVVTITLRNSNYVPIAGQMVTISTDNSKYNVKLANGTTGNSAITNVRGQAIFRVSSDNLAGICNVIATFDADFDLRTDIIFEAPGSLISQNLKLIVPFEMRDYDNLTWVYLTENALTNGYFINEMYTKNARPNNEIKDLTDIVIYLHPNKTYTMWAKGRYHKAKIKTFVTGSIGQDTIEVNFSDDPCDYSNPNDICDPGLLIGDLLPDTKLIHVNPDQSIPTPFHDNFINAIDFGPWPSNWFTNNYSLADFNLDYELNSIDFRWWIINYGPGAQGAPRPRCDI